MQNAESLSREQIQEFLRSSQPIEFVGAGREERYGWMERVLAAQNYGALGKGERGVVRAYVRKVTGLSEAQTTRLIGAFLDHGKVQAKPYQRHRFAAKYRAEDIALLAEVDRAHGRLSARYRNQVAVFEPTQSTTVAIGQRRRPDPQGRPGYLRVDTVHQGDREGTKGVYHINAVTQWQVVGCAEKISELYLLPVLEAVLAQFPFALRGFHADNGSEYINHRVAELLRKLHAEFTKSRACRSQDNALVEGKNGAVIRKLMGYGHIAGPHAAALQKFYVEHLNPYLNFHRPCGFATVSWDQRGKRQRKYKTEDYRTPFEKLQSLPEAEQFLKPGVSLPELEKRALAISDTECALRMTAAKTKLLRQSKTPSLPKFA